MDKKTGAKIRYDREILGLSYRTLGKKYGLAHAGIHAMLNKGKKQTSPKITVKTEPIELSDDIEILKEELRKAKLKIELQDLIIDVASKELGIDIRKKSGTRRSK